MSTQINLDSLRLTSETTLESKRRSPSRIRRNTGRFLKGPIQLDWLVAAAKLPGKSLHVAIALSFLSGLTKSKSVRLTHATLDLFGVSRHSSYRALSQLESRGLVSVTRHPGRAPVVRLLDFDLEG